MRKFSNHDETLNVIWRKFSCLRIFRDHFDDFITLRDLTPECHTLVYLDHLQISPNEISNNQYFRMENLPGYMQRNIRPSSSAWIRPAGVNSPPHFNMSTNDGSLGTSAVSKRKERKMCEFRTEFSSHWLGRFYNKNQKPKKILLLHWLYDVSICWVKFNVHAIKTITSCNYSTKFVS